MKFNWRESPANRARDYRDASGLEISRLLANAIEIITRREIRVLAIRERDVLESNRRRANRHRWKYARWQKRVLRYYAHVVQP